MRANAHDHGGQPPRDTPEPASRGRGHVPRHMRPRRHAAAGPAFRGGAGTHPRTANAISMSKTDSLRLFPLLLAVAPLAAQHPADIKTATKAPDPVKGPHQQGPLTDAELARLRPRPRLHPVGSVAHTITNPATTGSPTASQVLYGRVENGELWALADTYKAGFTPNGFTYVPFLGSSAPCNYPVHFVLRAVRVGSVDLAFAPEARVRRTGDRVILERGAVREIYDLAPQQVEQTFVVDAGLAGDVEIELAVVSDLTEDAERVGLMFCNHLGGVEYGTAFLV